MTASPLFFVVSITPNMTDILLYDTGVAICVCCPSLGRSHMNMYEYNFSYGYYRCIMAVAALSNLTKRAQSAQVHLIR